MTLSLSQLERHLLGAAEVLRGPLSPHQYQDYLLPLLFLKHASDDFERAQKRILVAATARGSSAEQAAHIADSPEAHERAGSLYVPPAARWDRIAAATDRIAEGCLSPALSAMAAVHPQFRDPFAHVDFSRIHGAGAAHADRRLRALIDRFSAIPLHQDALAYPDMIGAAYETLLARFSSPSARGEYFTPGPVVRLMTELARPSASAQVYDPCVGSGGMLIGAAQYVADHAGNVGTLMLAGQDTNPRATAMAAMNLSLRGVRHFDLRTGDTLADPQHGSRFDLVLSNPPFSMDYSRETLADTAERMPYGMAPEKGRADWMFVQHMLWAVRGPSGSVFTVLPHGPLYRDRAEAEIRSALLDADAIEAVIGLPAGQFTATSVPACILVLRSAGAKRPGLVGKVLIINADQEYRAERSRNVMLPEHIAKVAAAFHAAVDVPGFARVVDRRELATNGDNLNIRRYVDNQPPPEPQDVRAHLFGGMPRAEVDAHHGLLDAYGLTVKDLFAERPDDAEAEYLDFLPVGERPDAGRFEALAAPCEARLLAALATWWKDTAVGGLDSLVAGGGAAAAGHARAGVARDAMLASLQGRLGPIGPLDYDAVAGAFATWWDASRRDIASLLHNGYVGLVDEWLQDVRALAEPVADAARARRRRPTAAERRAVSEHPLVRALAPELTAEPHDIDATVRERQALGAHSGERLLVLGVLRDRLQDEIDGRLRLRLVQLRDRYRLWEEKYAASLAEVQAASDASRARVWQLLAEMGYTD